MSGHNKWTQIKRQKEKTDGQKSKIFGKFAKLITEEARKAKGNASAPGLKAAIDRARAANMPNDNIDRAIDKAMGKNAVAMESILYEAYGPGGSALLIDVLTSSRNKAAQEVKHILSEQGFSLANPGSAAWAFTKKGMEWEAATTMELSDTDVAALEKLIDALESNEEVQAVYTNAA